MLRPFRVPSETLPRYVRQVEPATERLRRDLLASDEREKIKGVHREIYEPIRANEILLKTARRLMNQTWPGASPASAAAGAASAFCCVSVPFSALPSRGTGNAMTHAHGATSAPEP